MAAASSSSSVPAPGPSLLPGQSPPFFTVTPTDQAGVIVNVAAICLVLGLASLLIRAYVRFEINRQATAWDDGAILAAVVLHIVQASLIFHEISVGLGKTIDVLGGKQITNLQRSTYADDIFYLAAVWTSKLSYALLFARTSRDERFLRVNQGLMAGIATTAVAAVLLVTIRCNLAHPWLWFGLGGPTCTTLFSHWQAIAVLDILTEVLLAAMAVYLIWPVQISLAKKTAVVSTFWIRLAIIAPIAYHLHYLSKALSSHDPTLLLTSVVLCKEVEIAFAILATNIPTLRPFIFATTTNYGAPAEGPKTSKAKSGSGGSKNSYGIFRPRTLSRQGRAASKNRSQDANQYCDRERGFPADGHDDHSNVITGRPHSSGSNDSKQIIIKKDYSVAYYDGTLNR